MPNHNAEFALPALEAGSAFVPLHWHAATRHYADAPSAASSTGTAASSCCV
jgi:hypothetical protein